MTENLVIDCAWCGNHIYLCKGDTLPKDAYAIERGDGDKFFFCNLDCAMWKMADWESNEWIAMDSHD